MAGSSPTSTASYVRSQIEKGGERFWRPSDFREHPPTAVAKALSRLASAGPLKRAYPGLYYLPRDTKFGPSTYSTSDIYVRTLKHPIFPAGAMAANILGFSTQNPLKAQYSTTAHDHPSVLKNASVRVRRPATWRKLKADEGAILEFIRDGGSYSELSKRDTAKRMVEIFANDLGKLEKICQLSEDEPARVRAVLGAIGEEVSLDKRYLERIRNTLSPFSRYDFGKLSAFKYAKEWQAR